MFEGVGRAIEGTMDACEQCNVEASESALSEPAGIAIDEATTFQFAHNLKTTWSLELTIPPTLLAGADEVID